MKTNISVYIFIYVIVVVTIANIYVSEVLTVVYVCILMFS